MLVTPSPILVTPSLQQLLYPFRSPTRPQHPARRRSSDSAAVSLRQSPGLLLFCFLLPSFSFSLHFYFLFIPSVAKDTLFALSVLHLLPSSAVLLTLVTVNFQQTLRHIYTLHLIGHLPFNSNHRRLSILGLRFPLHRLPILFHLPWPVRLNSPVSSRLIQSRPSTPSFTLFLPVWSFFRLGLHDSFARRHTPSKLVSPRAVTDLALFLPSTT